MSRATRRIWMARMAALLALPAFPLRALASAHPQRRKFIDQAFAMKRKAVENGDQPYGAVVVLGNAIVGWGPSRVVQRNNETAHAEREAMRDAQARLGRVDLSDCVMYSTSRPCAECQRVAVENRLARMYAGPDGADLGPPRGAS